MTTVLWLLLAYFLVSLSTFVIGLGSNTRPMYWWEQVLSAPIRALFWIFMRTGIVGALLMHVFMFVITPLGSIQDWVEYKIYLWKNKR